MLNGGTVKRRDTESRSRHFSPTIIIVQIEHQYFCILFVHTFLDPCWDRVPFTTVTYGKVGNIPGTLRHERVTHKDFTPLIGLGQGVDISSSMKMEGGRRPKTPNGHFVIFSSTLEWTVHQPRVVRKLLGEY